MRSTATRSEALDKLVAALQSGHCDAAAARELYALGPDAVALALLAAARRIAESCREVVAVHKLDFGVPEAFWEIRVEDFPCVVTMDSHGQSLHEQVREDSHRKLCELLATT